MCHGDTLVKENEMKNYNETNENTVVTENTKEKPKACSTSLDIWLRVFVKTAKVVFIAICHAIAFKQCFKALVANDDPTVKVLMGVLILMIIISSILVAISISFVEAFK